MSTNLQELTDKIISHPYFQKTKLVIENNECHDHQAVYDHLLLTTERAKEAVLGNFVTNPTARKFFDEWISSEKYGMKQGEIAVVTALLHDIGKIFMYESDGIKKSIVEMQHDGKTVALGHEYLGSTIVGEILSKVGVSEELCSYIGNIVRLHGSLMVVNYEQTKPLSELISEMKAQAEGLYKEVLFNTYCDVLSCSIFQDWIHVIEQMFNNTKLYRNRKYLVS